jgi:hypothetical protein
VLKITKLLQQKHKEVKQGAFWGMYKNTPMMRGA